MVICIRWHLDQLRFSLLEERMLGVFWGVNVDGAGDWRGLEGIYFGMRNCLGNGLTSLV